MLHFVAGHSPSAWLWFRFAPALLAAAALSGQSGSIASIQTNPSPIRQDVVSTRITATVVLSSMPDGFVGYSRYKFTYDGCVHEYGGRQMFGGSGTFALRDDVPTSHYCTSGDSRSASTPAQMYPRLESIEMYIRVRHWNANIPSQEFRVGSVFLPFERYPAATVSPRTFAITEKMTRTKARLTVTKGIVAPGSVSGLRLYRTNDISNYVGWLPTALFRCELMERATSEGFGVCDVVANGNGVDFEVITGGNLNAAKYEGSYTAVLSWQEAGKDYLSTAVGHGAVTIGSTTLGPPTVSEGGVVDAAQYKPVVSPCGIGAAFGTNMADRVNQASQLPLPSDLNGVSILINGIKAPLFFVSENQINFQVPCEAPETGNLSVVIDRNGQRSAAGSVQAAAAAPGVFVDTDTNLPIVLLVARRSQEGQDQVGKLITAGNPARPGDTLTVFLSGIGRGSPAVRTGEAVQGISHSVQKVEINVGGEQMTVLFAGYTPRFAGLAQVNFQIPAAAFASPTPNLLPFRLRVGPSEAPPLRFPVVP